MKTIQAKFGLIWKANFRNWLDVLKSSGLDFQYQEKKGWIFSTFTITGNEDVLLIIERIIKIIKL